MSLQNRILLAYGYLVVLVVVGAVSAALGFRELSTNIDSVLGENFESVQASISMLESLERQDSAVLGLLLGEEAARRDLERAEVTFIESLEQARANVTIEGERELLTRLAADFEEYRQYRVELVRQAPERPLPAYELSTYPAFVVVKDRILELVDLNHEAMQQEDIAARRSASTRAALHGLLVAIAVLSLPPLVRSLRVNVLSRIHELADVAASIAAGDRRRRATVGEPDELSLVAREFNAVLDQLQKSESEAAGETERDRRFLRALLQELGTPAALTRRDGRLVASNLDRELLPDLAEALEAMGPRESDERQTIQVAGRRLEIHRLADDNRTLGWLIVDRGSTGGDPTESDSVP